jgi:hypothetical protein
MQPEFMYRVVDSYDTIVLRKYAITKRTPHGAWVWDDRLSKKRFVLTDPGGKRFAYEEKSKAIEAFYHRKKSQVRILEGQLKFAKIFLDEVDSSEKRAIILQTLEANKSFLVEELVKYFE